MGQMLNIADAVNQQKMDKDETWRFFVEMGNISGNSIMERSYQGIKNAWAHEPAFIIGAGYDLREFIETLGWSYLDGKHTIGINHTIEDYDRCEWFLFLDKRFLEKTTYNMDNYKGRVFVHCSVGWLPKDNVTVFHTGVTAPTQDVSEGLYNGNLSGLAALNLAVISGANPIYMLGCGINDGASPEAYHYKNDYPGERKEQKIFDKYKRVMRMYRRFDAYQDRIIQVTNGKEPIAITNKIKVSELALHVEMVKPILQWIGTKPKIAHISFTNRIDLHADITRLIVKECFGEHRLYSQTEYIPPSDLYITEHFLSTDHFVNGWQQKERTINIVHTVNCIPQSGFLRNIALTHAWENVLKNHFVSNVKMIHGGIDLATYAEIQPNYASCVFGRITRYSSGKIHPAWNQMVKEILDSIPSARCLMYTQLDSLSGRPILEHSRMTYDKSCQIRMFKGDFLKNLSVYVHMNGSFKETLSFAVIEAMATGLPIVYLDEKTGVLDEVTGNTQIHCNTVDEVRQAIISLLCDESMRRAYGAKAKEQARRFDKAIMVREFDKVINECMQK